MPRQELLYLIYGKETPFLEGRYSILSAFATAQSDLAVTVITDRPEAFAGFPVHTVQVDAQTLARWRGADNFLHRAKICAMISRLSACEKMILMDADTIFLAPAERLFHRIAPGQSVMHCDEGDVFEVPEHTSFGNAWRQFASPEAIHIGPLQLLGAKWPAGPHMWNSGVVGVDAGDFQALQNALTICDAFYPLTRAHTTEQFALGVALFNQTLLQPARDLVEHYWPAMPYPARPQWKNQRAMYHDQAAAFFEKHAGNSFDQLVQAYRCRPARLFRITTRVRLMTAVHRRAPRQPRPIQLVLRQLGF